MNKTINGSNIYKTTKSNCLDFFANLGTYRNNLSNALTQFKLALEENREYAIKSIFYARDIRNNGIGERAVFRKCMSYLAEKEIRLFEENISNIIFFGRFDDVVEITYNIGYNDNIAKIIESEIKNDLWNADNNKPVSLIGKWLPSINASSKMTREKAKMMISMLNVSNKQYRQICTKLRKAIKIVESQMCSGDWDNIDYEKVPSLAMKKYKAAFFRHSQERMEKYIEDVSNGNKKINSSVLYPYDIVKQWAENTIYDKDLFLNPSNEDLLKIEQWKALPNYIDDGIEAIVVADTSASMTSDNCIPISTAIGLGVYFAERNKGIWHNKLITFSSEPRFIEFHDSQNIMEKIHSIPSIVENTNIDKVYELLFNTAIENNVTKIPTIIIVSDMQFDNAIENEGNHDTIYEKWCKKFADNEIEMPHIVFWNAGGYGNGFEAQSNVKGVSFVSGHSASVFRDVVNNIGKSPYEMMVNILNSEIYKRVVFK